MQIHTRVATCRGFIILSIAVLSSLMPGCLPWEQWVEPEFSDNTVKAVDAKIADFMEDNQVPGTIVGVWSPQGTLIKGYGVANRYTHRPITPRDKVRIGSVTKSFTATVILQLVDEGLISLDDTIDTYIANVPNGDKITLRQLGNMTSGLAEYTANPTFSANINKTWTPEELVAMSAALGVKFEPGTSWMYCNTNYILLGMVIEKVTGNPLAEEIHKRIVGPLNMTNTFFATTPEIPEPFAHGYSSNYGGIELQDMTFWKIYAMAWAAGANVSTVSDLRVWIKALYSGELLSESSHQEQINWVNASGEAKYGLGVFQNGRFFGHDGSIAGYMSAMYYMPEQDAVIIALITTDSPLNHDVSYLATQIADVIYPE